MRHLVRVLLLATGLLVASAVLAPGANSGHESVSGAAAGVAAAEGSNVPGAFAFLSRDDDGAPLRFDPCHAVRYTVNSDGAPAGAVADIHEAFRRAGAVAGIEFRFTGFTTETHQRIGGDARASYQPERYGDLWAPILVSFVDESDEPVLTGNVLGYGGSTSYWTSSSDPAYVTGEIVLDRDLSLVQPGFGPGMTRGNLIQHELGHVVGLDHVEHRGELMFESISERSPDGYTAGDRTGLAHLGAAAGCLDIARAG